MQVWIPVIIQAIIAATTIVGGLLILRKTNAEAHKTNVEADAIEKESDIAAAEKVVKLLQEQVDRQAKRIETLEKEFLAAQETIAKLRASYEESVVQLEQLQTVNAELVDQNKRLREQVRACAICAQTFGDFH